MACHRVALQAILCAVTSQTAEHDPTDLLGADERALEGQQREIAVAIEKRDDLVWMLSGRRGRRSVRRSLREAGFNPASDVISSVLDRHHGQMCFNEGHRTQGLQMIWPIMRLLASGELPIESFRKLMQETDE